MRVEGWEDPAHTVTSSDRVGSGALSIADPRWGGGALGVRAWQDPAQTIGGESHPTNGAHAVADPRVGSKSLDGQYVTSKHYGVVAWTASCGAITGSACQDNGAWSVADPRLRQGLPGDDERCVPLIISLDGTWHRPFTTLELGVLQGYPAEEMMAQPLDGGADTRWRLHIGNSVPPPAAQAIGSVMAEVILRARVGQVWTLDSRPIWVRRLAIAVSLDVGRLA